MIPRTIHQTWSTGDVPGKYRELVDSWKTHHPDWDHRLWTDDDLDALVAENFPGFLEQFRGYRNPVQRADAGRYLILYLHGGVYADLDTRCHQPFDAFCHEDRIVLAQEPVEHFDAHCQVRNIDHMLFNGTMVSPKGHPFWMALLDEMKRSRHARDVLDTTGPLVLTGCVLKFDRPDSLSINSCHLFNPLVKEGTPSRSEVFGDYGGQHFSTHYWFGSWYDSWDETPAKRLKKNLRRLRYHLTRGPYLSQEKALALVDRALLDTPVDTAKPIRDHTVCCMIPLRDAEPYLDRCIELIRRLDHPKPNLRIAFCEGDSTDRTMEKLRGIEADLRDEFGGVTIIRKDIGNAIPRAGRWRRNLQRSRRGGLAKVRNFLIDEALGDDVDWALWIDCDVDDYPADTLSILLRQGERIVAPNCVLEPGGPTYDLNSFTVTDNIRDNAYYKHVHRGLYMPPPVYNRRLYFHDLRYCERVNLFGVGGTMLLVHAAVHRAGVRFPEIPYHDLLETEGFGYWARDCGIVPVGLPNLEIRHVRS